jgi:hypothetical protein
MCECKDCQFMADSYRFFRLNAVVKEFLDDVRETEPIMMESPFVKRVMAMNEEFDREEAIRVFNSIAESVDVVAAELKPVPF